MKKQHGKRIVKPPDAIYCAPVGKKERGIFAAKNIKKGTVVYDPGSNKTWFPVVENV